MGLILNIDTSGQEGIVSLAKNGVCIDKLINYEPMQHAAFLQPAIKQLILQNNFSLNDLDAISVSNGPGSYTGLRVGLASAKGLCFAIKKPLISINTLKAMALAVKENILKTEPGVNNWQTNNLRAIFCPMIDARRMEVFFAVYGKDLEEIVTPSAIILTVDFLYELLSDNCIFFSGNGISKWQKICNHPNAIFFEPVSIVNSLCALSEQGFQENSFADTIRVEPFYYKEFYTVTPIEKI